MRLRNYPEALKTARALIEPEQIADVNVEYARGIVEFIADLYSEIPGDYTEERKRAVAADLGIDPVLIA